MVFMNKRAFFGINFALIGLAFVVGLVVGGFLVAKAQDSFFGVTGFFSDGAEKAQEASDVLFGEVQEGFDQINDYEINETENGTLLIEERNESNSSLD